MNRKYMTGLSEREVWLCCNLVMLLRQLGVTHLYVWRSENRWNTRSKPYYNLYVSDSP